MSHSPDEDASKTASAELVAYRSAWTALNQLIGKGSSFSGHERNCCFLNTGSSASSSPRFADVSAATGLDFEDDGRAVAVADWDFDGDVDLWLANRNAPRVRFVRNDTQSGNHWLSLRLRGVTCNRDAIGARVEVVVAGDPLRRVRTLYAGDGYLSQSSKWLYFGLAGADALERVVVSWPGGERETFSGLRPDRCYLLVEGSGRGEEWTPPGNQKDLVAAPVELAPLDPSSRTVIVGRAPAPESFYQSWEGERLSLDRHHGRALLVSLWSRTCGSCIEELAEFTSLAATLRAAGLEILALDVDGLDPSSSSSAAEAREVLAKLGFPFLSGRALPELVADLELVHRTYVELQKPLPVPASFLFDAYGRLSVIYKGRLQSAALVADVAILDAAPARRRESAVYYPGRWASEPFASDPRPIARALEVSGQPERAARYVKRYVALVAGKELAPDGLPAAERSSLAEKLVAIGERLLGSGSASAAAEVYGELLALAPEASALQRRAGVQLLQTGRLREATAHLRLALEAAPDDPDLRYNYGLAELGLGRASEAATHFRKALEARPDDTAAHFHLSNALLAGSDAEGAVAHLRRALELQPGWPYAANNLAWILATHEDAGVRDGEEAVRVAEELTRADGGRNHATLSTLAAAYAEAGRFEDAALANERAIAIAAEKNLSDAVAQLRERQELYRSGRPFRNARR